MIPFKKIVVFYFSGTGNSKQIAAWILALAIDKDIDCRVCSIVETDIAQINSFDEDTLICFTSPVHGFNYPKIMLDFIRCFPKGRNHVVLMNTRAGMKLGSWVTPGLTGVGFMLSSFFLVSKGYKILGQVPFDLPSNWISIHPALRKSAVDYIFEKMHLRLEKHFNLVVSGRRDFAALKEIIPDLLISPIALGYYLVGRFFLSKSYYASHECIQCHYCIKQCPVKAIMNKDNRPYWSFKCESCMKCMNHCPKNAIETTHLLWVFLFSIVSAFPLHQWLYDFLFESENAFVEFLFFNLILFFLLFICYRVQHFILKYKWAARLISLGSLTHYNFWGRYKGRG